MFKFNLQTIGARNLKTSLSVFICIIVFELLGRSSAFFACIAAMMCMQDTVENSYKMGKNRMLGTFLGAIVGLLLTAIFNVLSIQHFIVYALLTAIGTTIAIYLCIFFNRILDTFIGVIIAIIINRVVYPYQKKTEEKTN